MKTKIFYLIIKITFIFILFSCNNDPIEKNKFLTSTPSSKISKYNNFDSILIIKSKKHNIDWQLIKAIIIKESHFDSNFISIAGAVGLMQLMPREGSYISNNFASFMKARSEKRNKLGERLFKGRKDIDWAKRYCNELDSLVVKYQDNPQKLYEYDSRFNPKWNLELGISQISSDFSYFRRRGHSEHKSRILALAAYNSGRGATSIQRNNPKFDRIPINNQTELYIGYVEKIYRELKKNKGKVNESNIWILKL